MNLNAYDIISPKIDKTKSWIDVDRQQLLSRELKYRPYVTLSKRYSKEHNINEYFVILLDECPLDRPSNKTKRDDYGRIKINLKSIWTESSLCYLDSNRNIEIIHVESEDDGDIYKINV